MNPSTTFPSNNIFIELHRTFHELSKQDRENDDIDINTAYLYGEHLSWSDLLKEYRLIILSEAGSGKTCEIRNIASTLRAEGKTAFFLRLENIPGNFEDAFEVGSYEAFEEWLASGMDAWLLLDSVDEARLRSPGDFELAIRKLGRRIITALDRTHIVITGRTTAWRPKTDLALCATHLPYTVHTTSALDPQMDADSPEGSKQTETIPQGTVQQLFKIVTLDNLSPDQISQFIKQKGIEDTTTFLEAVERKDAWSFTSRPQDLEELVEFWLDNGTVGTRLELMRNNINQRLSERDQGRADARPLSAERARQGSRLLAAATTLTQVPAIRVPDGSEKSPGIAVQSVLPDWDDRDQSTLLSRPIFDEAIYSTVRFHHRSVREYLTAEWFNELLKRETSRRSIETLFFRNQYGLDIIVPSLRPILPWLVILDDKIRERALNVAPEIILEGGDPVQLPLEVRRTILHKVCEQIAEGAADRTIGDYASVQRFATPDLTEDVRELLQKYKDNEDLTAFMLRMIWLGQLHDVLPEAMNLALTPTTAQYVRITAFRAVKAVGTPEEQEHVRKSFLKESPELNREWLNELIVGIKQPTDLTLMWLLASLEKVEPPNSLTIDQLPDGVTEFVEKAADDLLPQLASGLNKLLSLSPLIERRFCEISEHFQWLIASACKVVERLISLRHPASLESDVLDILYKASSLNGYGNDNLSDVKADFSKLVPAWKDLNRALFWYEVQKERIAIDKEKGARLTNFMQVWVFRSYWRFQEDDFQYITDEITRRPLLDDRLVALSLAFYLYKEANRPPAWREQLKKLVAGNDVLSESLGTFFRPPTQSPETRRWKQHEAEQKKRLEAQRKKQEEYHTGWKTYLNDHFDELQATLRDKPETIINPLLYLFDQTRKEKHKTGKWTEYNWKTLIPEYGEEIARFYRDGTVSFWRHHNPTLRSEGAPLDKTTYAVIIGLTGLEIEANETSGWPKKLSASEAELACKYASFELNGFPTWFPKLFENHPKIVCDFLLQEIRYELSIEKPETDTFYIIGDVSWSGQWVWDTIAPGIYDILDTTEPENLANLDKLLKILQGSNLSDDRINTLASGKCKTLEKPDHTARWFAVWTGVSPYTAIASLKTRLGKTDDPKKRALLSMTFITHLLGNRGGDVSAARQAFKTPDHLKSLYLLMHEHIRPEEDIHRAGMGVYSPELRDDAQDARNNLFTLLNHIPGKEAFLALTDIAESYPDKTSRSWIMTHAKAKAEQDGDSDPWKPSQVRDFFEKLDRTPGNHRELADLAVLRLLDLKDDLEEGDSSIAGILRTVTHETDMRKFIGRELREKAFGRYTIPQEEELADARKPDLRFQGNGFDGPVPVELKLADNWNGPPLFEHLENQLCGDYLRDNRSRIGIFLLVYRGDRNHWELPGSQDRVDFTELTEALQNHWHCISGKFSNIDNITVLGIDLTKRSS